MKVSSLIIEKLFNCKEFRLTTALVLKVSERTIMNYAHDCSENLTKYAAVNYFKSQGFKENEIFDTSETTAFIKKVQDEQMTKSEKASR